MYSGDAMYIFRPSTSWGIPALGMAEMASLVLSAIRSTASSMPAGPTLQLRPTASAPASSMAAASASSSCSRLAGLSVP